MDHNVIHMDQIGKELARAVDDAIRESGLSVRHVADKSGISFTTLNRKIRGLGQTPLNAVELYHIAQTLKRPLSSLLPEAMQS